MNQLSIFSHGFPFKKKHAIKAGIDFDKIKKNLIKVYGWYFVIENEQFEDIPNYYRGEAITDYWTEICLNYKNRQFSNARNKFTQCRHLLYRIFDSLNIEEFNIMLKHSGVETFIFLFNKTETQSLLKKCILKKYNSDNYPNIAKLHSHYLNKWTSI